MIVITGAGGQLGTAFEQALSDATLLTRPDMDLADPIASVDKIRSLAPSVLINCAAFTNVDGAESDVETAMSINGETVGALAAACAEQGTKFVTFSTDYVFDGTKDSAYTESDKTSPINVYGASKLLGEELTRRSNPDALVIRTSWVLSGTHPNFAATMLRLAKGGGANVVADQKGCPTMVADLVRSTLQAIEVKAAGVLHMTNSPCLSWYELARLVLEFGGFDPELVQPITTAEFPTPAARPANSMLTSERLEDLNIAPLPAFEQELKVAVNQLLNR